MIAVAKPHPGEIVGTADARVILHDVPWAQYEAMLAWRGESAVPRMAYLEGVLEIMNPSRSHESIKRWVASLVEIYALEADFEFSAVGSWLLKRPELERGLEPDECYIVGDQDKDRPDLAIEVIWTSGGLDKLEIYRGLEVPEVWLVRGGNIEVYRLENTNYVRKDRSVVFRELDLERPMKMLDEPSMSQAMRKFRDILRNG